MNSPQPTPTPRKTATKRRTASAQTSQAQSDQALSDQALSDPVEPPPAEERPPTQAKATKATRTGRTAKATARAAASESTPSPAGDETAATTATPDPQPATTATQSAPTAAGSAAMARLTGTLGPWARRLGRRLAAPAGALGVVLIAWYVTSYLIIDEELRFLLPPPHAVISVALLDPDNLAELLQGVALSARVAVTGLALSVVLGGGLAIVMNRSSWMERSVYPYAVALQTVPVLALVPLLGYWFGFGFASRVLVCVLISIFPIIANTLFGLRSVDPGLRDLFRLHRAGWLAQLLKLKLPAALPAIFTGLRISAGASVIGAVVGDYFFQQGSPGIGQLISIYQRNLEPERLFAAAFLASMLGLAVFWFFGGIARRVNAWHESESDLPTRSSGRSTP